MDMKTFERNYKYICERCGKFTRIKRESCIICGSQALRKATKDDYIKVAERILIELKEDKQIRAKMKGMVVKQKKILQALLKNEAEYNKLLERKKSSESVGNLIKKNRDYNEKLKKENKENSEIGMKWVRSEEGEKTIAHMAMWSRMNPAIARNSPTKKELELKMAKLNDKIQKNKEEYEKLLEIKNKGEYVDDLIKRNRYTAETLKQSQKSYKNAMSELRTEKKSDWKSKIKR